jgi:hypothetical protein
LADLRSKQPHLFRQQDIREELFGHVELSQEPTEPTDVGGIKALVR